MAYFNNAATTFPKPESVYSEMDNLYRTVGFNSGRSNISANQSVDSIIHNTRNNLKKVLNINSKKVIFQPSATISINLILNSLFKNNKIENVYISPFEHNAITRTLFQLNKENKFNIIQLDFNDELTIDSDILDYQFKTNPPDLVIMSHVSNVIGLVLPILEVFSKAKKYKSFTLLDMSQSAGIVDIDLDSNLIDYAVFAGHKTLYGPLGLSGFVMKPNEIITPLYFGGTGIDSANQEMPKDLEIRLEAGSQNLPGIFGLNAALKWLLDLKQNKINLLEKEIADRNILINLLKQYQNIEIIGNNNQRDYTGIISCRFNNLSIDESEKVLSKLGIIVRSGLHCSPLAHKFLKTFPEGTLRFSTSYFTNEDDFRELDEALQTIDLNF